MRMRLPRPVPAVKRALALLPHRPGVYIFRNHLGRVIYVGRSRDLASRTRSYWSDLGDRPHLRRMLEQVEWLEPVLCTSEHEAAFLESDLLERHPTRWNRTLGMESCVWLRLDANPASPGLGVEHEPRPRDGARWFGPYLGWEPARQGAAGLERLYPLRYTGTAITRSDRELGRSLGVGPRDFATLVERIERVLARDAAAVAEAIRELARIRDRAAEMLMFEHAASVQRQIRGVQWICEPQKLAALEPVDGDFGAVAGDGSAAVGVVLAVRGGRLLQRHVVRRPSADTGPAQRDDQPEWIEQARENAALMSRLVAAEAVGPLGWRA